MSPAETTRSQRSAVKSRTRLRPQRQHLRTAARARACAALIAAIAAVAGAVQLAAPQPAAAAGGLQLERAAGSSLEDDAAQKAAVAYCPDGKFVVGGGGAVWNLHPTSARLTGLVPSPTAFVAQAATAGLSGGADWRVAAYAVCADKDVLGADRGKYRIVPGSTEGSARFKTALARCPAGTVAYGSGADVPANGRVGLQMTRTSGPLDISRATGRADNASTGSWTLTSYAICALPAGGIHSEGTIAPGVFTTHHCTPGDSVAGPGGGGGLVDGGTVWLKVLYPFSNFDVEVQMTGFLPDRQVLASPTCADRS